MKAARAGAALLVVVTVTGAAIGWLYAMRAAGFLNQGPHLHEALPLQRLAHGASQPLLRIALAWLPAGIVAGLILRTVGWRRRSTRAALMAAASLLLLLATGAAADAVTETEPIRNHLSQQPHRPVIWLAAVLAGIGAAIP
jgi:hypothetical protein